MAASPTVNEAIASQRYTLYDGDEGRAGLECLGKTHSGALTSMETLALDSSEVTIVAATGLSAGIVLPKVHRWVSFVGFALNPVASKTAWDALGSDALRDNAIILDDTEAPIGSTYKGYTVSAGAVTASKEWLKTAANTWTDLTA